MIVVNTTHANVLTGLLLILGLETVVYIYSVCNVDEIRDFWNRV